MPSFDKISGVLYFPLSIFTWLFLNANGLQMITNSSPFVVYTWGQAPKPPFEKKNVEYKNIDVGVLGISD